MDIQTETMKRAFLGWQCRLRQIAVREEDGRPTPGMRPQFDFSEDGQFANAITVLIVRVDAFADASQFRHLVLRSQDPAERLASGGQPLRSSTNRADKVCLLYKSPSPRDATLSSMES